MGWINYQPQLAIAGFQQGGNCWAIRISPTIPRGGSTTVRWQRWGCWERWKNRKKSQVFFDARPTSLVLGGVFNFKHHWIEWWVVWGVIDLTWISRQVFHGLYWGCCIIIVNTTHFHVFFKCTMFDDNIFQWLAVELLPSMAPWKGTGSQFQYIES